jgi:hypothetical protein
MMKPPIDANADWTEDALFPLPMNLQTDALVLRDLETPRFKGSRQEDFRGILTPALSPGERRCSTCVDDIAL